MSVEVSRSHVKQFKVVTTASGHQVTVSHFLWMARELQEAVDQGMPESTQVRIDNTPGVNGVTIRASAAVTQALP